MNAYEYVVFSSLRRAGLACVCESRVTENIDARRWLACPDAVFLRERDYFTIGYLLS